ncbi:RING-box protein 2 [Atta colombica]|uniref:RING-box protein 2 n=1 Tax=Atta colombica TaxID=520822 RepID=A0A195BRE6_9HYME|nr:RING-box protein 2 [Atta colombica]
MDRATFVSIAHRGRFKRRSLSRPWKVRETFDLVPPYMLVASPVSVHACQHVRFTSLLWKSDACLRCQAESKKEVYGRQDCVVVWGECNHSFHYCCMSLWVKQNNRCPLCQQEWSIQRMGK